MSLRHPVFVSILCLSIAGSSRSAVPHLINYQGRLTNPSGSPLSGSRSVQFTIYDAFGTAGIWQETQTVTSDQSGLFAVLLGSIAPLADSVFGDSVRYLGIKVGSDPEIAPRTVITSAPYALRVGTVDGSSGGKLTSSLQIGDSLAVTNSGINVGSTTGRGGYFQSSSSTFSSAEGLRAEYTGTSGTEGIGVRGRSAKKNNFGIGGWFDGGRIGVIASVSGTDLAAYGIQATAFGSGNSDNRGVTGTASSGDASNVGVDGHAGASGAFNAGVQGFAGAYAGKFGTGIYGGGTSEIGGELWAGYFAGWTRVTGNLYVDGTVYKQAGGFKIDHPLDPEHRYLQHSFVESPDMKNVYDGVITTDNSGNATIVLPDYFEVLNRDYRCQLTVQGQFAQAIVAADEAHNTLPIKTDKPNVKVYWQVTGIRKDPYAEQNRISVEVAKTGKEIGTYLYPAGYGQPESKSVTAEVTRQAGEVSTSHTIEKQR